ncbi:hypothetical protein [Flaviaesturariibacter terrae]
MPDKHLYARLGLSNLALVALFGVGLRLKILFELPFIDYRNLLSAHSHFAFAGWVGFMLLTVLLHYLLPADIAAQKKWGRLLLAVDACALGMAFSFPFGGYRAAALIFSSGYILLTYVFAVLYWPVFRKHASKPERLLVTGSILSLLLSAAGPAVLAWMIRTGSADSLLYRDAIYWFLHFQYNGFFTLALMAWFFRARFPSATPLPPVAKRFAGCLTASVLPSLFLALLWHNRPLYYAISAVGVALLLASLYYLAQILAAPGALAFCRHRLSRRLLRLSFLSLALKLLLQAGTILPSLGNAVYGDRPVIIGFLHLVFLGFVSFCLLAILVEEGYFTKERGMRATAIVLFAAGVFANEALLMLQGLGVLLGTNSRYYSWGLLAAALLLLAGAVSMAVSVWRNRAQTDPA